MSGRAAAGERAGRRWEIVLRDYVPASCLSLNGRRRAHWRETWKAQQDAKTVMYCAITGNPPGFLGLERAAVAVTFVYPTQRRRDPDGLAGLAKPLLDAMVNMGMLVDDDSEHIELTIRARVESKRTETRITVEEVTG